MPPNTWFFITTTTFNHAIFNTGSFLIFFLFVRHSVPLLKLGKEETPDKLKKGFLFVPAHTTLYNIAMSKVQCFLFEYFLQTMIPPCDISQISLNCHQWKIQNVITVKIYIPPECIVLDPTESVVVSHLSAGHLQSTPWSLPSEKNICLGWKKFFPP